MPSVFIVEDDKSLQSLYMKILQISGFDVIGTANDGEEAVSFYKSFIIKPDIIIMDHRMPIKNGLEAAKEILTVDESAFIIFASADLSVRDTSLSIGAKYFLKKPFSMKTLVNKLNELLLISHSS